MLVVVNYWAVLAAAIASMIIGSVWYSKYLFGNQWMLLRGEKPMTGAMAFPAKEMGIQFVASLVTAYFLAQFTMWVGAGSVLGVLVLSVWIWIGFYATTALGPYLWEKRPWTLYFIGITQSFVTLLAMGAIIGLWR